MANTTSLQVCVGSGRNSLPALARISPSLFEESWLPVIHVKMGFSILLLAGAAHPVQQDCSDRGLLLHPVPALPRLPGECGGHRGWALK